MKARGACNSPRRDATSGSIQKPEETGSYLKQSDVSLILRIEFSILSKPLKHGVSIHVGQKTVSSSH